MIVQIISLSNYQNNKSMYQVEIYHTQECISSVKFKHESDAIDDLINKAKLKNMDISNDCYYACDNWFVPKLEIKIKFTY